MKENDNKRKEETDKNVQKIKEIYSNWYFKMLTYVNISLRIAISIVCTYTINRMVVRNAVAPYLFCESE